MGDRDRRPRAAGSSAPVPSTAAPPRHRPPPASETVAWLLADAVLPHAPQPDRHTVYIQLGCRHYRRAIAALLQVAVRQEISIPARLAAMLAAWLDAYRGHDDQPRLHRLVVEAMSHPLPSRRPLRPPGTPAWP
jgi:hypothetical protein